MKNFNRHSCFSILTIFFAALFFAACARTPESAANSQPTAGSGGKTETNQAKNSSANANNGVNSTAANKPAANDRTSAQCSLVKAPAIKGFALGQTVEEIDRRVNGFKAAYEREKEKSIASDKKANFVVITSGSPSLDNSLKESEYTDYSFIWHFMDEKLIAYVVKDLSDATAEMDLKAFLNKVAKENNLPAENWKIDRESGADLNCQGFQVSITAGGQPGMSIMVSDTAAEKERDKRRN